MAQIYQSFNTWYETYLSWIIKQQLEVESNVSEYKRIDKDVCKLAVNRAIDGLVLKNTARFETVYTHEFEGDTKYLNLPADIAKVSLWSTHSTEPTTIEETGVVTETTGSAIIYTNFGDGTTQSTTVSHDTWHPIYSSLEKNEAIRKHDDETLYNSNGWHKGDKIDLLVVRFPPHIQNDSDILYFPRGHWELLDLEVVDIVYYQSGQAMPANMVAKYQRRLIEWMRDGGKINGETTRYRHSQKGIGR